MPQEARPAFAKDITAQRERMVQGLEKLQAFVESNGSQFATIDDFDLYYWLKEMKGYFKGGLLPGGVETQLREVGFPFDCEIGLASELASQVKPARNKKRYAYRDLGKE